MHSPEALGVTNLQYDCTSREDKYRTVPRGVTTRGYEYSYSYSRRTVLVLVQSTDYRPRTVLYHTQERYSYAVLVQYTAQYSTVQYSFEIHYKR